ncbi:MAG: hypothetical protein JWN32_500, partial [Solirubrobacterales bacterium]|nr:hypothetical protein [Solirubrobacterales bacterium]
RIGVDPGGCGQHCPIASWRPRISGHDLALPAFTTPNDEDRPSAALAHIPVEEVSPRR